MAAPGRPADDGLIIVLPAKHLSHAKSRMAIPDGARAKLAMDLLAHAVTVTTSTPLVRAVVVVTPDERIADAVRRRGVEVVLERAATGLNQALVLGRAHARLFAPRSSVGLLVADLPGLASADLEAVHAEFLRLGHLVAHVPDRAGTGTTMVLHTAGTDPTPLFGPHSARRHRQAGFPAVGATLTGLRRDVDTVADLRGINTLDGVDEPAIEQASGGARAVVQPDGFGADADADRGHHLLGRPAYA